MCTADDITFMNERIDFITDTIQKLSEIYDAVKEAPKGIDEHARQSIEVLRKVAVSEIASYFTNLEILNIPAQESYLTHWMEVGDYNDLLDATEHL